MIRISQFSCSLLGFSFLGILHTSITFGILIGIALVTIIFEYRNHIKKWFFKKHETVLVYLLISFILSLFISCLNSSHLFRSLGVSFYLIIFILSSFLIYKFLTEKIDNIDHTLKYISYSIIISTLIILIYNLIHLNIYFDEKGLNVGEVRKFKGVVNLITLLVCLFPFFSEKINNRKYIFSLLLLLLIPILIISNSKSSILGIIGGSVFLVLYLISKYFSNKNVFITFVLLSSVLIFSFLLNYLPKDTEKHIDNTVFKIPTYILDPHRQFIWGFVVKNLNKQPFFGIGPDTSNFIEGSQRDIGHWATGDMNFIPSHPHNFILEIILEIGFVGSLCFFFLIFSTNFIFLKDKSKAIPLIFLNGYFWTSSLVTFSFWNAWWQGSYFFILAILFSKIKFDFSKIG